MSVLTSRLELVPISIAVRAYRDNIIKADDMMGSGTSTETAFSGRCDSTATPIVLFGELMTAGPVKGIPPTWTIAGISAIDTRT